MLQEGKTYLLSELKDELKITKYYWENRKDELLEYFKLFFDYEIIKQGKYAAFFITKVYGEYQPLPRKTRSVDIKEFYRQETEKVVKYQPWNTGANIARKILSVDNKYQHAEGTAANYVRPILKEEYCLSEEKQWMEAHYDRYEYVPITKEQEEFLKIQFKKQFGNDNQTVIDIMAARDAGYMTEEEVVKALESKYSIAMNEFLACFGFRPIKVGKYIKKQEYE